jgi:tripartite-type tricarboxylate transporter receptor subunit TctC
MAEFVARARANPGTLTVGSAGVGALTHLSLELLKREAKLDLIHVPFRSSGGTLPALIGDQINAMFGDVSLLKTYVQAGKITPLAIASPQRSPLLPELVTMAEAGLPGIAAENWYGLVVSSRTPPAVVMRLRAALLATHDDPAYQESLIKQGISAGEPGAESFDRLIRQEVAKWKPIVTAPGFKIE